MKRWNASEKTAAAFLAVVFGCMTVLNFLTPYICDDWVYRLSFVTKEPLQTLGDVVGSMYLHCFAMNGRVVSHSLEQLFMLPPKWVFNFCNAGVYTLTVYLVYRIANAGRKGSVLLLSAIAMGLWCAMPAFGQVALWQVGSLNYLWALTFCLVFLLPFIGHFLSDSERSYPLLFWVCFCLGSLLFGMYSEITSFVGLYLAAALLLLSRWMKGKSLRNRLWIPIAFACAGYIIMLTMPAQIAAKMAGGLDLASLAANFIRATGKLVKYCTPLLVLWAAAFVPVWRGRIGKDRLVLAVLLLTGALGANYMTMVAAYYPERCLCTTVMLLILSIGVLAAPLERGRWLICAWCVLLGYFALSFSCGVLDIADCHQQFARREAAIASARESGETELILDIVVPSTQYSPFWDLRDLSTEDAQTWPNSSMAKYYGADSILGRLPQN